MPNVLTKISGGATYADPFLGPASHPAQLKVDVSALTTGEVDAKGYLKPNVPFKRVGSLLKLCDGTAAEFVYGVNFAAIKLVAENPTNVTLAADTSDPIIAVATIAQLQRDICEDNLGRAFNVNELAAFERAGDHITVTAT